MKVASPEYILQTVWGGTKGCPVVGPGGGQNPVLKLNSVGLKKVDVKAYTTSGLLGVGLLLTNFVKYNMRTYQCIPVRTNMNQVHMSMY